jgi:hypothetical protein
VDNIRIDLGERRWGGMDWIDLAKDKDQWRAILKYSMNFRYPRMAGRFLSTCTAGVFSRKAPIQEVIDMIHMKGIYLSIRTSVGNLCFVMSHDVPLAEVGWLTSIPTSTPPAYIFIATHKSSLSVPIHRVRTREASLVRSASVAFYVRMGCACRKDNQHEAIPDEECFSFSLLSFLVAPPQ